MPRDHEYGSPGQKLQPAPTYKEWPEKVLPAPQKVPGQTTRKSPTK